MSNLLLVEEQKFETLLNKIEQIHHALIKKPSSNVNEINGFVAEKDACKLISKSKTWLWRKRTDGELPYKKLGSKIFYHKNNLFNLLKDVA